jgi:hypothetical protein
MIPYFGHTRHTNKAPHKPISQGYKVWGLGDHGYIFSWLWYSKSLGTEGLLQLRSSQRPLADTQALVISLAESLPERQGYTLYLDNLFTNVPLANALGELGIGVMCYNLRTIYVTRIPQGGKGRQKTIWYTFGYDPWYKKRIPSRIPYRIPTKIERKI